jgi:emfourin
MRGKKSDSDRCADWQCLSIEESGGFAGLRRGATLERSKVKGAKATRIGSLLGELQEQAGDRSDPPHMPDAQVLTIQYQSSSATWQATFDTADLPQEVMELAKLFPSLKPMPLE